jgi:uncharacterized membrane protein YphA (DoxX/SURF4 family)
MSTKGKSDTMAPTAKQNGDWSFVSMYSVIRILLGLVFLSAALFRILNYAAAEQEISRLALPSWTPLLVILLELAIAAAFLTNRFVRHASLTASIFLAAPIGLSILLYSRELFIGLHELFVFNATPTDIFLHVVFLILLILIFMAELTKRSQ